MKRSDDMSDFSEFYNAIDDIYNHLKTDFIGPVCDDEIIEIEDPLSRYSLGILWAQPKTSETDEIDDSKEEMFEDISEVATVCCSAAVAI